MRGRSRPLRHVRSLLKFTARVCFLVSSLCFAQAGGTVPASAHWKEVATAMGRPGQPQPGDVMDFFAVGFWAICRILPVLFVTAP